MRISDWSSDVCSSDLHDEILVALFGIGHVGLVSDADDDRLADVIIFLNPPRFGKGREAGIAVEYIKDRISGLRRFSLAGKDTASAIAHASVCLHIPCRQRGHGVTGRGVGGVGPGL